MVDEDGMIYRELGGDLVRYASALVGPDDGPDLVSEVIVRVLAKRRLADLDDPRRYLFKAIGNEARSRHRRRAHRSSAPIAAGAGTTSVPDPDGAVDAVLDLPVRQRAATYLVYWLGYTPTEAADLMGCRPGTVRRYLHLARRRLAEVLDDAR